MKISEILYPKVKCIFCKEMIYTEKYLCNDCRKKLIELERNDEIVGDVIKGHILYMYKGMVKDLIGKYKYYDNRYIGMFIGDEIGRLVRKKNLEIDVVVPIPIYWKKKAYRGFNQSEIIARRVSRNTGIGFSKKIIKRKVKTKPLNKLDAIQRTNELRGSFKAINPNNLKTILLIDDIYTTGSTVSECGLELYNLGFENIIFIAFAGNH